MTEQQSPPMKLVTYTSSTRGATPVTIQAAARGKDVTRRANRRPRLIIQSPIMAPNQAPSMDREATHEASCCVTERADLRQMKRRLRARWPAPLSAEMRRESTVSGSPDLLGIVRRRRQTSGANVITLGRGGDVLAVEYYLRTASESSLRAVTLPLSRN